MFNSVWVCYIVSLQFLVVTGICHLSVCCEMCFAWQTTATGSMSRLNLFAVKHLLPPAPFSYHRRGRSLVAKLHTCRNTYEFTEWKDHLTNQKLIWQFFALPFHGSVVGRYSKGNTTRMSNAYTQCAHCRWPSLAPLTGPGKILHSWDAFYCKIK